MQNLQVPGMEKPSAFSKFWSASQPSSRNGSVSNGIRKKQKQQESSATDQVAKNLQVNVFEIFDDGTFKRERLNIVELVSYFASPPQEGYSDFKRAVSCFRDLMIFLKHLKYPSTQGQSSDMDGLENTPRLPAILPRSGMGFYLIDLFQLKVICRADKCLVLDHSQTEHTQSDWPRRCKATEVSGAIFIEAFIAGVTKSLQSIERGQKNNWQRDVIRECAKSRSRTNLQKGNYQDERFENVPSSFLDESAASAVPFEMVVLDTALQVTSQRFSRQLRRMRPIFNKLLEETLAKPSDTMLEKILAFKKSLLSFEINVGSVKKAVDGLLENDLDMADLYLSQDREMSDHEEVELLLEGYRSDMQEVQLECRSMRAQIDDIREFINTHQNETRNRIIQMNLFMEMFTLGVTFAACASAVFGMNLKSGLLEHPYAFYLTTSLIVLTSCLVITVCMFRFRKITNSGKAKDYPVLKDIFKYIDTLDLVRFNSNKHPLTKDEFGNLLMKFVSEGVKQDEVNLIFPILGRERDGNLDLQEFQHIMQIVSGPS